VLIAEDDHLVSVEIDAALLDPGLRSNGRCHLGRGAIELARA
jgi:hypothetical protein